MEFYIRLIYNNMNDNKLFQKYYHMFGYNTKI